MKEILLGILNAIKTFVTSVGPLKIVLGAVSVAGAVVTAIKGIKSLIKKIRGHKKNKTPSTITEAALCDKETREANPEMSNAYDKSVKKTAQSAFNLSGKKPKKHKKRNDEIRELTRQLNEFTDPYKGRIRDNDAAMGISEYCDRNPSFKRALFGGAANKSFKRLSVAIQ